MRGQDRGYLISRAEPGGMLHVADWGKPSGRLMRPLFYSVQILDGFANTRDHVAGRLPDFFREAGLQEVALVRELSTIYGTWALYSARKAPGETR